MSYYYWDENFRSNGGLTLQECLNKYGIGKETMGRGIDYQVIFLDEKRDFGYSWMLRCYRRKTGENVPVRLYEQHKVVGVTPTRQTA